MDKLTTARIYKSDADWLKNEQARIYYQQGQQLTVADVLRELIQAWVAARDV